MISRNCSSKVEFEKVVNDYQPSIIKSGYAHILQYKPKYQKKKRTRSRQVTWFNPPWSNDAKTNLAGRFLKLVDEYKEKIKGTPLEYVFTRATFKISYCTTRNMKAHIAAHNKRILRNDVPLQEGCTCRTNSVQCPLDSLLNKVSSVQGYGNHKPNKSQRKNIPWYDPR